MADICYHKQFTVGDNGCYCSQHGHCFQVVYVYLMKNKQKGCFFPSLASLTTELFNLENFAFKKVVRIIIIVNGTIIVASCTVYEA